MSQPLVPWGRQSPGVKVKSSSKLGWRVSKGDRLAIAPRTAPVFVPTPSELVMSVL